MEVKTYQNFRILRSEVLLTVTLCLGLLHHLDHVLRADRSGWPFIPEVTPFTFSLVVYPLFLSVFLTRSYPWYRVIVIALAYIATQMGHILIETPLDQYSTWAYGISNVSHSLGKPNLLGISSPVMGIYAAVLSLLLSVAFILTLFELIRDARSGTKI